MGQALLALYSVLFVCLLFGVQGLRFGFVQGSGFVRPLFSFFFFFRALRSASRSAAAARQGWPTTPHGAPSLSRMRPPRPSRLVTRGAPCGSGCCPEHVSSRKCAEGRCAVEGVHNMRQQKKLATRDTYGLRSQELSLWRVETHLV